MVSTCKNHMVSMWKPPNVSFPGSFQTTIQASHGNYVETMWFLCGTTKVVISRIILRHNPGKPWKPHGFHMETTKVVIFRLISNHNPANYGNFYIETMKVIVSRLISSHNLDKSLVETMSFPHGNQVETDLHEDRTQDLYITELES